MFIRIQLAGKLSLIENTELENNPRVVIPLGGISGSLEWPELLCFFFFLVILAAQMYLISSEIYNLWIFGYFSLQDE